MNDIIINEEKINANDYFEKATNYFNGDNDYLQDYEESLKNYKLALDLGCLECYEKIASFYIYGLGVDINSDLALKYLKEGVNNNQFSCYVEMSLIYLNSNVDNSIKCWKKYFESFNHPSCSLIKNLKKLHLYINKLKEVDFTTYYKSKEMLKESYLNVINEIEKNINISGNNNYIYNQDDLELIKESFYITFDITKSTENIESDGKNGVSSLIKPVIKLIFILGILIWIFNKMVDYKSPARDYNAPSQTNCYQEGYDYGKIAAEIYKYGYSTKKDKILPSECRGTLAAEKGIQAGTEAVLK